MSQPFERESGASLIEVLVAAVITATVVLGAASLFNNSLSQFFFQLARGNSAESLQQLKDSIRRDIEGAPNATAQIVPFQISPNGETLAVTRWITLSGVLGKELTIYTTSCQNAPAGPLQSLTMPAMPCITCPAGKLAVVTMTKQRCDFANCVYSVVASRTYPGNINSLKPADSIGAGVCFTNQLVGADSIGVNTFGVYRSPDGSGVRMTRDVFSALRTTYSSGNVIFIK